MSKIRPMLLLLLAAVSVRAQTPTGALAGTVTDPVGARVSGASIRITNRDSGLTRNLITSVEGAYSTEALPSGSYQVIAEAAGFQLIERTAIVEVGTTTSLDLTLRLGNVSDEVTVTDAAPLIRYDQHLVGGLVTRGQIENLPLNGRNFLELAKLEPGVTNTTRGTNNRTFVPVMGSGLGVGPRIGFTRITVDGGNINIIPGIGAVLNVSQDVVQEFQIATVNFDLSTSMTSNGAVNIVTRSGGNQYHGGGFYFFRDHNLAAYPALSRDPSNPDPFFQRRQFGYQIGGPIRKDRVFFFTSYERNEQRGVNSVQPRTAAFVPFGGVFVSPFRGNQFNLRFDARVHPNHSVFVRYTHDGNRSFSPLGAANASNLLPSAWSRITNWADQSLGAITSVLSPALVNDLRFSYFFHSSPEAPASIADCAGCIGVGSPRITIPDAGVMLGQARRISGVGRRYEWTDSLVWHRGDHRIRFGVDWERNAFSAQTILNDPATINLYSPDEVRRFNATAPLASQIPLPSSFTTIDDILRLPLRSFMTNVGPGLEFHRDFRKYRVLDRYRIYAGDTWHTGQRLTLNYGLGWSYEPNSLNTDLTKPKILTAVLGADGLAAPSTPKSNFSPSIGFAWTATHDGKTVIRGGVGRYFDPISFNSNNIANERRALSPAGTGRRTIPSSAIFHQGRPLNFPQIHNTFTGADLLAVLQEKRAELLRQYNPDNRDLTFRNIDLDKSAPGGSSNGNLSDPFYETPYAIHVNFGVQRELSYELVLSTDFAWRRFLHNFLPDIDYNRFERRINGVQTPVIPLCTAAQRNDVTAVCSAGTITFDNTTGIAEYKGLLVRLEKRFSRRTQFLAAYALGSYKGTNGAAAGDGFNNDNWFENYGPLSADQRHILNLSGIIDLPRRFQVSFSMSAYSRPPFSAFVNGIDFNGDGTTNDLLPGTTVNQFNRGLHKENLERLVEQYNQEFAGKPMPIGTAPPVSLPAHYAFGDGFLTQDLRVSHRFTLGSEQVRLSIFGEVFNLFNIANLVGYSGNIGNSAVFGQPGARSTQVFGSGGPRAFQFGSRVSF